ncbi:MAG: hypothetical protein AAB697_01630 [Patescibacteria group bacterium]
MNEIEILNQRVTKIEERNKKVEGDKAWETSYSRKFLILLFTYFSVGVYLQAINVSEPWLNAIVPTVAFLLSTFSLSFFKMFWEKYIYKK